MQIVGTAKCRFAHIKVSPKPSYRSAQATLRKPTMFSFFLVFAVLISGAAALPAENVTVVRPTPLSGAGQSCDNWEIVPSTADLTADCKTKMVLS